MKLIKITVKSEWVDETTGETFVDERVLKEDTKKIKTTSKKKKVKEEDNDPIPKLTLEDTKYKLNTAALELLQAEPGDKLDIKYQKVEGVENNLKLPIIGLNTTFQTQGGNKLSKTNTVICRGTGNDRLSEYGHNFILEPHPHNDKLFILKGDAVKEINKPEEIEVPEGEEEDAVDSILNDVDLDNAEKEEINATDFDFSL